MKLKENKICDALMSYLRDLFEHSYTGEEKAKLNVTWPVSIPFELIVTWAYRVVLETIQEDRFKGKNATKLEAEVKNESHSNHWIKFAKMHLLGHLKILESQF